MKKKPAKKKVKFHNPPNVLRKKIGYGGIAPEVIERAEQVIIQNDLDFEPVAVKILERLDTATRIIKVELPAGQDLIGPLTGPVMELKANGAMFKYALLSQIADNLLNFLENTEELNQDGFELLEVHRKTLHAIFSNRLKGHGGREGQALTKELTDACQRYYKKYGISAEAEDNS